MQTDAAAENSHGLIAAFHFVGLLIVVQRRRVNDAALAGRLLLRRRHARAHKICSCIRGQRLVADR
jgi:hypothetical protein